MSDGAAILRQRFERISPWVEITEIEARMPGEAEVQTYHGMRQADSLCILAMRRDGMFPVVRQFRPLINSWTVELVGGKIEPGEDAVSSARREVLEETGLDVVELIPLVAVHEEVARLTNRYLAYFALVEGECAPTEPGLSAELISGVELKRRACNSEMVEPSHSACLYWAATHPRVQQICRDLGFAAPPWL